MRKNFCALLVLAAPALAQQSQCNVTSVVCINPNPTREFGQPTLYPFNNLQSGAPNLVEGRELFAPRAIAFDASVTPPIVYVVDTGNNRVLAWKSADELTQGNFADLVIGQPGSTLTSTGAYGPASFFATGLTEPTGIAVDASGNVYVADSGNNRILRYQKPFSQQPGNLPVDLVIGQKTANSGNQQNLGNGSPSASSLFLSILDPSQVLISAGLAVDGSGNLWVADPGNNRVLRFPASSLTSNNSLPQADVVLGQTSFTSNQLPTQTMNSCPVQAQCDLNLLEAPNGVAVDSHGNVYVSDQLARVVQFTNPGVGQNGSVVLGSAPTPASGQPLVTYPTSSTLGGTNTQGNALQGTPQGVFVLNTPSGASVFVADTPQNRVVRYDTFGSTWKFAAPANSPSQNGVYGQPDFLHGQANEGQASPNNSTFYIPVGGAIRPDNQEMWIVDQGNNRVLAFALQNGAYSSASRVVGQTDFIYSAVNLIQGKELWINGTISSGVAGGGSIAIDNVSNPGNQYLYIADTFNNRVLGFKNAQNVGVNSVTMLTQTADLVIGQADLLHNLINAPGNSSTSPTATGLWRPVGLAVDSKGNLWVADAGNGRVVRFPAPFAQPAGAVQTANLVLGQASLTGSTKQVTQFNMIEPYGLTLFANGSLAVSDPAANRILVFNRPSGGDFMNGAGASLVVGQSGFTESASGNGNNQLNSPRGIAVDSSDRLYVCDHDNFRLIVFSKPAANDPTAALEVPNLSNIRSVAVSFATGYSWVAVDNGVGGLQSLIQLPEFNTLQATQTPLQQIPSVGPLAVALDPYDNVITGDSLNRVTFNYDALFYRNTASYSAGLNSATGPSPTMLAELHLFGGSFNFTPSYTGSPVNLNPPWPLMLNNIQVTVAGIPAPIFRIDTPSVNDGDVLIEIPNGAPSSGPADFIISNTVTGQIYGAATLNMQQSSPALFTSAANGTGQAAAENFTSQGDAYPVLINGPGSPVARGDIIDLWLTGAGNVPGLPADGIAPGGIVNTPVVPTVFIGGQQAQVIGSAMSPDFPGVWQINAIVPKSVPPSSTAPTSVVVIMNDYPSNIGGTGTDSNPGADRSLTVANGLVTTISVK